MTRAMQSQKNDGIEQDREVVAGLAKGLAIIEAFSDCNEHLTLSEVARTTGLSPASARRCLRTLESLGYAESDGRYFALAPRMMRLSYAYISSRRLPRAAQPVLEYLTEITGNPASVGVLDGANVVFVAAAMARRTLTTGLGVGSRLPAHCSATGRVLMAEMSEEAIVSLLEPVGLSQATPHTVVEMHVLIERIEQVRSQGYALVDEELELGVRSLAVPLRNSEGIVVAGMSLAIRNAKLSLDEIRDRLLPPLEGARRRLANLI